jgi:hypothetical protein
LCKMMGANDCIERNLSTYIWTRPNFECFQGHHNFV